jgi:hypothetical protein
MGRGKSLFTKLLDGVMCEAYQEAEREAEREAKAKARQKRRLKCRCAAYPWPHRPAGGLCRYPAAPLETWKGTAGKNAPANLRRRGLRKQLLDDYGLHPIKDRERIRHRLPQLYRGWCKRNWRERYWELQALERDRRWRAEQQAAKLEAEARAAQQAKAQAQSSASAEAQRAASAAAEAEWRRIKMVLESPLSKEVTARLNANVPIDKWPPWAACEWNQYCECLAVWNKHAYIRQKYLIG